MPRYEELRDRLPTLYRPDEDETDLLVPLAVAELTEIRGDDALEYNLTARDGTLIAERDDPAVVREFRIAPGKVPGPGYALEVYRLDGGTGLPPRPAIVADVDGGIARLPVRFRESRFALQLRRRSLLSLFLVAVADVLERLNREASGVMQAHWFPFADRALYSPFFLRTRALEEKPPPKIGDDDVLEFPYIDDLGRLASLLSLPPWQEPVLQQRNGTPDLTFETVETYRERIGRIVDLYRNGLGTLHAIRGMTEAQLPVDLLEAPERQDRPFSIEEFAPLVAQSLAVRAPAEPTEVVGPLMHWTTENDGLAPVLPTVYLQGPTPAELAAVDADGDTLFDEPVNPMLELGATRLGIAYTDTVPAGHTLRLRPAYSSFIALDAGVRRADALPTEGAPADPTAPGPWVEIEDAPDTTVTAILQSRDHALWVAANDAGKGKLWRYDGQTWQSVLEDQPELQCLAEDGDDLLVGSAKGLLRLAEYPADGTFAATADPGTESRAVNALMRDAEGTWWVGTDIGAGRLGPGNAFELFGPGIEASEQKPVYALATDATGTIYLGSELGLFQYQPGNDRWYWYAGESASETANDWKELRPGETDGTKRGFPKAAEVFLPAVRSVRRGPDESLWVGTDAGLARYVARSKTGTRTYTTLLEAFPDLGADTVFAIEEDAAGLVWFCTARGLFRFDGRDLFQFQSPGAWMQLGRADRLYHGTDPPLDRGAWRFDKGWQRADLDAGPPRFVNFTDDPRTTEEPAVRAVAFADSVAADLLEDFSPDDFSFGTATALPATKLVLRRKLDGDTRVVDGGLPAVPRLPAGTSMWRYLSLELTDRTMRPVRKIDGPAWTIEGRLIPPDDEEVADALPEPGRYFDDDTLKLPPFGEFNHEVFAYKPAARVWLSWGSRRPLTVLTRLRKRSPDDNIDPAALDRVWQGIRQVRPAGVRAMLAVDDAIVRRENHEPS